MLIVDAHEDIAFNAVTLQRDYTQPVAETRSREGERTQDIATLGLPDALAGGVGIVFGTIYVLPAGPGHRPARPAHRRRARACARAGPRRPGARREPPGRAELLGSDRPVRGRRARLALELPRAGAGT